MVKDFSGFIFVEFAEGAKAVEVLRPGTFIDRNGKTVQIADEDLDTFVANFEAGAAGQDVPVDVLHERAEAAGWIKRLFRQSGRLMAEVEWNDLGKQLVGDKVYRYLSATIDEAKKLIKSISLVNFPAVKGLAPVELAEGVYTLKESPGLVRAIVNAVTAALFGENDEGDVELVIRKEGNEIILYSSDESKVLGRFPFGPGEKYASEEAAREAARKRERQVQYFKHAQGAEMEEDWAELQGNIKSIIGAWAKWAGSHTKCVRVLKGKPGISNEEALCAWLHKQAEGKWPAEGAEHAPTLAELQAMVAVVLPIIAELDKENEQMDEKELAELREQIRQEVVDEMAEQAKTRAELEEEVRKEVEAELTERLAERHELVEFAERVCGGEDGNGLSAKPDELVEALELIPAGAERKRVMAILEAKVVEFGERGSAREGRGGKKKLEEPYASQLREWLAAECDLDEWFKMNEDVVGSMGDYELSEFEKK